MELVNSQHGTEWPGWKLWDGLTVIPREQSRFWKKPFTTPSWHEMSVS